MTVRQVFYQLVVRDVIEKTEQAYKGTVIRLLTDMRMSGVIPFAPLSVRRSRPVRLFDPARDREAARPIV